MNPSGTVTAWLQGGDIQGGETGPLPVRPLRLILMGPPGGGKGTMADMISTHYGAVQLSTGEVFRHAAKSADASKLSPVMQQALAAMKRGELVSDDTVVALVRERAKCFTTKQGFLLDGFPRTAEQAAALDEILARVGRKLDAVVSYFVDDDLIIRRLSGRRLCRKCRAGYHLTNKPPRVAGVCDACGGELIQRDDDKPEAIKIRLKAYADTSKPLLDYYRQRGLLLEVDGSGSAEAQFERTQKVLKKIVATPAA